MSSSQFGLFKRGEGIVRMATDANNFSRQGRFLQCHMWYTFFHDMQRNLERLDSYESLHHRDRFRLAPMLQLQMILLRKQFMSHNRLGPRSGDRSTDEAPASDCTVTTDMWPLLAMLRDTTDEVIGRYEEIGKR